jgi:tRNA-Thr(GGU) m(6)t(6)A37 methyltransferase TsaA
MSKREDVRDRNLMSKIIVRKGFTQALEGIEDFSHVFVVFHMHQISDEETQVLKVHPRSRMDLPLLGVFATRTAFRPNPIGLTLVELVRREGNVLFVRGLDAFNGTPVLDLKPYDHRDMVENIRVPEWHWKLEEKQGC